MSQAVITYHLGLERSEPPDTVSDFGVVFHTRDLKADIRQSDRLGAVVLKGNINLFSYTCVCSPGETPQCRCEEVTGDVTCIRGDTLGQHDSL